MPVLCTWTMPLDLYIICLPTPLRISGISIRITDRSHTNRLSSRQIFLQQIRNYWIHFCHDRISFNYSQEHQVNRDIVCRVRIIIDSLPKFLRNSKILFDACRITLGVPKTFYRFREQYDRGEVTLSELYTPGTKYYSTRISPTTDINSKHLAFIKKQAKSLQPSSVLDVGCGSGFLLQKLEKELGEGCQYVGIDYSPPRETRTIRYIRGAFRPILQSMPDSAYELVTCTHTLEHVEDPSEIIPELMRVCTQLVLIVPLETKYKWGLNYHINFYPTTRSFLKLVEYPNIKVKTLQWLGDLLVYICH